MDDKDTIIQELEIEDFSDGEPRVKKSCWANFKGKISKIFVKEVEYHSRFLYCILKLTRTLIFY